MGSEVETLEDRLRSMLGQLQAECGILGRMVYKNKNQHRRCSYFQYLLKVRRDLRLLQSVKLEELVDSCFLVIKGKRPKQRVHLLESLKIRKCDGENYNFMERLLGAARLLSQMVEPMLMAATEISVLLARSFFMGFSVTILGLLARFRVLVQQILLDVVSLFNMVSSLSQKKQYIKIDQEGIEVFREFYPTNDEFVNLECVWESDKFVLHERKHMSKTESQDGSLKEDASVGALHIKYESIESILEDDEFVSERVDAERGPSDIKDKTDLLAGPCMESGNEKAADGCAEVRDVTVAAATPRKELLGDGSLLEDSKLSPSSDSLRMKAGSRKVAFVSVKNPPSLTANVKDPPPSGTNVIASIKEKETNPGEQEDPFFNLLTGGNVKNSLF